MKKVLFVASTGSHILNFHIPYIRQFKELGWGVSVACGEDIKDISVADYTLPLPFTKRMSSPRNLSAMLRLRRHICSKGYDLMICHTSLAAFFARAALFGMKNRPAVCNMVHGYLFDDDTPALKRFILTAAEKLTAPVTDLLIAMNAYDLDYARHKRLAARTEFVFGIGLDRHPSTVDEKNDGKALRSRLGFGADKFLLLYAAEFSKRKSQATLISALSSLPEDVILLLPGKGALLDDCRELAMQLGLEDRVVFPGHIRDMSPWYLAADAAVSASRSEGIPFNLLEAMHYGLPMVASQVKGHTDLIEDSVSGLLFPFGDSDACAKAILRLKSDHDFADSMTAKAKEQVEKYRLSQVLPQVMELYLSVKP